MLRLGTLPAGPVGSTCLDRCVIAPRGGQGATLRRLSASSLEDQDRREDGNDESHTSSDSNANPPTRRGAIIPASLPWESKKSIGGAG
jgi:hypothetical protein